jgi:hypothetical protein
MANRKAGHQNLERPAYLHFQYIITEESLQAATAVSLEKTALALSL